jgi:hypothetical protein
MRTHVYWYADIYICYASDAGGARAGSGSTSVYVSAYHYICVLMLLYACPHTTMYVSSYYYVCVLMLLYVSSYSYVCVLIVLYNVFSCCCMRVLILQCLCPHATMYVALYCYICHHITVYVGLDFRGGASEGSDITATYWSAYYTIHVRWIS